MQSEERRTGRTGPATFSAADSELEDTLDSLDGADNYTRWIMGMMEPYLGADVLEVGAGHGTFTEVLAGREMRVVATDLSERCAGVLRSRFFGVSNVEVVQGDIQMAAARGPFDAAVLINVLEHIEDDDEALRQLWATLKVGGRLLLWVPAFEALYTDFDRKIGHFRRYRRETLSAQLGNAGFTVVEIRYANSIGAVAWWLVARVLRRTPTRPSSVKLFDRYVLPIVKLLEAKVRPPFGQSILAVAVRPEPAGAIRPASARHLHS
jgi:SAM-dependent methyltransferase